MLKDITASSSRYKTVTANFTDRSTTNRHAARWCGWCTLSYPPLALQKQRNKGQNQYCPLKCAEHACLLQRCSKKRTMSVKATPPCATRSTPGILALHYDLGHSRPQGTQHMDVLTAVYLGEDHRTGSTQTIWGSREVRHLGRWSQHCRRCGSSQDIP